MTSTTASSTPPDDISQRDEIAIDMDALKAGFGQIRTYYIASPLMSTDSIFLENVGAVTQLLQAQAQALHQQDEIHGHDQAEPKPPDIHHALIGHDQAEPKPPDIHHALMKEILRNQNNTPDVSKKLLEITGASVDCLLQLAYRSPGSTSPGPLPKVVAVSVCIAPILLLTAMMLRDVIPRAAKVVEKLGLFVFIFRVLLLMYLFTA